MPKLTQSRVKEILDYNPDTGIFTWKIRTSNRVRVGNVAGTTTNGGYTMIGISGTRYQAHRLAWLYVYGKFPTHHMDHINHIRDDNKIANLRVVTKQVNQKNMRMFDTNSSGITGVSWHPRNGMWRARISHNGKPFFEKCFHSFHKAVAIRKALEIMLDYHPNHGK